MALPTDTIITIGELVIHNFSHLEIIQKIHDHHTFTLEIPQELLETNFESTMPAAENLMGQRISIEIKPIANFDDPMIFANPSDYIMQFSGIIEETVLKKDTNDNMEETILIKGHSLSKLLDNGAESNSFIKNTLSDIVNKIKSQYNIDMHVRPYYENILAYTVQYNESDFDFLNRMSMRYGQWLYDTGQTIVFGTPGGFGNTVTLIYGVNMQDFRYKMKIMPTLFKTIENDNRTGEYSVDHTTQYRKEADGFHQKFLNKSDQVFNKETLIQLNQNPVGGSGVSASKEYTRNKMREVAGKLMEVKATSEVPGITLGNNVKISGVDRQHETYYRVTEIIHTCDDSGSYKNHFTAVNLNNAVFSPNTNPDLIPMCSSQSAIVTANHDADGLSAVQVQMPWQKLKGVTTPYIPLLQYYGGNARGSHILPEIGDTVLVYFQGGNAEMPIVTGTLPNLKEKSGYATPDNDIKALHTKSNNRLVMNDKVGSILLEDSSKSFMDMSGNRKIEVNTDEFTFNVKRLIINATESTQIITNDYLLNALSRIYIFSRTMKQNIQGFMNLYSGKALINSNDTIDIEAKTTKLHGTEQALIHSDKEAVLNSKGTAMMHGDQGNNATNTAIAVEISPTAAIALAVVYFRPTEEWHGEYGFDWLREKDNLPKTEIDYESIIKGGYKDGKSNLDEIEAFIQLKNEYDKIPIARKQPSSEENTEYFVPYLTLFSREFVDSMPKETLVKPKYEADLKILLNIGEHLEKLEFEYDEALFEISIKTFDQKMKTKGLEKLEKTIKVTCIKDLDSDKEINVYAYPKGITDKSTIDAIDERKLAGRIKVLKNDSTVRREEKFVLVEVSTTINNKNKEEDLSFTPEEKYKLYEGLHQALILPVIEETTLDLSTHPDFQINGKHVDEYGQLAYLDKNNYDFLNPYLHRDVCSIFLESKDSSDIQNKIKYFECFTIFKFAIEANDPRVAGAVQDIGVKNVIIFKSPFGYKNTTLIHEASHGLGLCHTHGNSSKALSHPHSKYIYPMGTSNSKNGTNNIMSYSDAAFTTWQWQWQLVNPNINFKKK